MLNIKHLALLILLAPILIPLESCKCSRDKEPIDEATMQELDTLSTIIKFEDAIFPIPSPWQIMQVVEKLELPYNDQLLNKPDKYPQYSTSFKQALNLGVYGANLGYLSIYERTQESISYLNSIKKLSEELGINQIFDPQFFSRIEENLDNRDSLIHLMANSYRESNLYLKTNDRSDIGSLIIAGSWIESMYTLTHIATSTKNREIINRIGEQKHPLDNLIDLLTPYYYRSEHFSKLIDSLIDIAYEFDGIIFNYTYSEPVIDAKNRSITINSKSRVIMSEYHLQIITKKIELLRNSIVE